MTYYYNIDSKQHEVRIDEEKEHCHLVYINKRNVYQDGILEERAMNDLTPIAFVAYCYLSIKPRKYVWAVSLESLPMDEEDAQNALNELIGKGYLEPCNMSLCDKNGEVVEVDGFAFYEQPARNRRYYRGEEY